jgi:hypothetical protein
MKTYRTPQLVELGSVKDLTLGGSSGGHHGGGHHGGGSQKHGRRSDTGNGFPTRRN